MTDDITGDQDDRQEYRCPKCGKTYHFRIHRAWLVKQLSFVLPVKRFYCAGCKKKFYVWVKG